MAETAPRPADAATDDAPSASPRLAPIETPSSWTTTLAYTLARWQLGTVITPLKVVWARLPEGLRLTYEMNRLGTRLALDPEVHLLVQELVATINGCAFCQDIGRAEAPTDTLPHDKLDALLRYPSAPVFDDAERAALAYAEEITREVDVADDTFGALRTHFDERAIVELTWLVARENYYNRLNRPLGIGSDGLCEKSPDRPE
jgi:alkylhydroperoxidase family enzyme